MKRRYKMPFGAECRDDGSVRFRLWAPAAHQVEWRAMRAAQERRYYRQFRPHDYCKATTSESDPVVARH
jgi:1,4-alpha-glucan branching enzyme